MNAYLALVYGKNPKNKKEYAEWLTSHQPFHWYAEFYRIIEGNGGFDVVIGNPPYVEYSKVKGVYTINEYETESCGNIYAYVVENCIKIAKNNTYLSFIIPSASICTPRMNDLITFNLKSSGHYWISIWDERPSKLFDGVDQQLSIHIFSKSNVHNNEIKITQMNHWKSEFRPFIFQNVYYLDISKLTKIAEVFPKIQNPIEIDVLKKVINPITNILPIDKEDKLYYRNAGGRYWRLIKSFPSYFKSEKGKNSSSTEKILLIDKKDKYVLVSLFSSTLFYWYWRVVSNCRHLTQREFDAFNIPSFEKRIKSKLEELGLKYEKDVKNNAVRQKIENKNSGLVEQDIYTINLSKPVIDEIDKVLAQHYGFTDEELDFIVNYDIKYRMGGELDDDEK